MRSRPLAVFVSVLCLALTVLAAAPSPHAMVSSSEALLHRERRVKPADRAAAARRAADAGLVLGAAATPAKAAPSPAVVPDLFGPVPNWAFSPLPRGPISAINVTVPGSGYTAPTVTITDAFGTGSGATASARLGAGGTVASIKVVTPGSGYTAPQVTVTDATGVDAEAVAVLGQVSGGIRKFVDPLPTLAAAVPESCTYSGQQADCYEIHLRQYEQKLHSDLPPTRLRGYVQVKGGKDVSPISFLGPFISARRDRPVRIRFVNELPTGAGGNLFLPVDVTYMGAGVGPAAPAGAMPSDCAAAPKPAWCYSENRATSHLHGGATPWISDGTPHQWTTPAGEPTAYPSGVSVVNVPDMDGGVEPPGTQTFYYSNAQSARLMFFHDHAYGITRLNVYAGEVGAYLLTDPVEQDLVNGTNTTGVNPAKSKLLPGMGTPLLIMDRSFVDADTVKVTDPTWRWGKTPGVPATGDLWFPHVYMPNQDPWDPGGANPMGRWDYGPWFWPPFTGVQFGPVPNPYCLPTPPADSAATTWDCGEAPWEPPFRPAIPEPSGVPEAFMDTPLVNGKAYPTLNVPAGLARFRVLNASNERYLNLSLWVADEGTNYPTGYSGPRKTEVQMVPFNSSQDATCPGGCFPKWWYTSGNPFALDDRAGGVPNPARRGPAFVEVANEGGFLPAPALIRNQPVNFDYNRRSITVGNVLEKALFLGPAERADVLVDFTRFAGKTLILYSDAPAPVPAADPRVDYYTGDPDQVSTGGAPPTLPGYGPNTRTLMQIVVGAGLDGSAPVDDYNAATFKALQGALASAFSRSQETIIVPQAAYNAAYGGKFPADSTAYVQIHDTSYAFTPIGSSVRATAVLQPKAIMEEFTADYGRMNAVLGNEIPFTNITNQTSILQAYQDPPVELLKVSEGANVSVTDAGTLGDGTQLWKVTHNGVDTHVVHTHLFAMQLVNRVGWDGAMKPPDPNELGWKDTVRMNPLEDAIVAVRPLKIPALPFQVPDSVRALDPMQPLGGSMGFTNVNPLGNPVTVRNTLVNFGWEYVYHCHMLGHEESDMMRPVGVAVPPVAPTDLAVTVDKSTANATWTDASISETGFILQRQVGATGPWTDVVTVPGAPGTGSTLSASDKDYKPNADYAYRVVAFDTVGSTYTGYPRLTVQSATSAPVLLPKK